nr:uncharacterized protein LOC127345397 [Lolium perenne]
MDPFAPRDMPASKGWTQAVGSNRGGACRTELEVTMREARYPIAPLQPAPAAGSSLPTIRVASPVSRSSSVQVTLSAPTSSPTQHEFGVYREEVARRLVQILVKTKVVVMWIQEKCLDNVKQVQMMFKLETFF